MRTYITTPIFYASGKPHLGHAYSGFIADTIKRYYQIKGIKALLVTGTDENGQKIERIANSSGTPVRQFVDNKSLLFSSLWQELGVKPDEFIRTTDIKHHRLVAAVWNKLQSNGDIYLGKYDGRYCVECEQYYGEWQLVNDCCPIHRKPVEHVSESSYLFRLDKYRNKLLEFYSHQEEFIEPRYFQKELIQYLQQSKIEDLSISRTNITWGIKVPNDEKHIIYVWLDALFSYLTALKSRNPSDESLKETVHIIGKDILQFHGIYWPAFLLAANLPFPRKIVVHGWWTVEGDKISKSNPTNAVDPISLANITTNDGLRYGLLRQKPLDRDGDLKITDLCQTINSDLANNLGNLVKRFVTIVNKYYGGKINWSHSTTLSENSERLIKLTNDAITAVSLAYNDSDFQRVCALVNDIVSNTNAYIHKRAPWEIGKHQENGDAVETLCVIYAVLKIIYSIYYPIIPGISRKIQHQLHQEGKELLWPTACELTDVLVKTPETIFERIKVDSLNIGVK